MYFRYGYFGRTCNGLCARSSKECLWFECTASMPGAHSAETGEKPGDAPYIIDALGNGAQELQDERAHSLSQMSVPLRW